MGHRRHTFGFTEEGGAPFREDRFSPQNEADYERLARIAAAEAAGTDLLLDVRDIELYAHVSRKTVYRLVGRGLLPEKRVGRSIRVSKRALDAALSRETGR
jgi:excisionase family DNA binding protein